MPNKSPAARVRSRAAVGVKGGKSTILGLTGSGFLTGDVYNNGTIDVGGPGEIGSILITGIYNQGWSGFLLIDISGTQDNQYDFLDISGEAQLDGTLQVILLYSPLANDFFRISRTFSPITTPFRNVYLPDPGFPLYWDEVHYTNYVTLKILQP